MKFEKPEWEVIELDDEDVIRTSEFDIKNPDQEFGTGDEDELI